jgi:hypothetical protein
MLHKWEQDLRRREDELRERRQRPSSPAQPPENHDSTGGDA